MTSSHHTALLDVAPSDPLFISYSSKAGTITRRIGAE